MTRSHSAAFRFPLHLILTSTHVPTGLLSPVHKVIQNGQVLLFVYTSGVVTTPNATAPGHNYGLGRPPAGPPVLLLVLPTAGELLHLGGEAAPAAEREHEVERRAALELVVGCGLVVDPV